MGAEQLPKSSKAGIVPICLVTISLHSCGRQSGGLSREEPSGHAIPTVSTGQQGLFAPPVSTVTNRKCWRGLPEIRYVEGDVAGLQERKLYSDDSWDRRKTAHKLRSKRKISGPGITV